MNTYWLVGANENAIQKKHFDIDDLPPPLFCRPRRSPKLNYDSRQPSLIGMPYFGELFVLSFSSFRNIIFLSIIGSGSRRESSVPRADIQSTYSLQGSMHCPRESPRTHRKLEMTPLYLNEGSRITLENNESENESLTKKPLAMVRPRQLRSIVSSDDYSRFRNPQHQLRESRSLDPFPSQKSLRKRIDGSNSKLKEKLPKRGSRSLDGGVSLISHDPDIRNGDEENNTGYKHINNNCNGSIGVEDAHCPLLFRQGSLTSPHDENNLHTKRWRSLQTVGLDENSVSGDKKTVPRGSIRSWIVGFFQGNGFRSSDASLRKVGVVPSSLRGHPGFGELPPFTPEKESIV